MLPFGTRHVNLGGSSISLYFDMRRTTWVTWDVHGPELAWWSNFGGSLSWPWYFLVQCDSFAALNYPLRSEMFEPLAVTVSIDVQPRDNMCWAENHPVDMNDSGMIPALRVSPAANKSRPALRSSWRNHGQSQHEERSVQFSKGWHTPLVTHEIVLIVGVRFFIRLSSKYFLSYIRPRRAKYLVSHRVMSGKRGGFW